MAWLMARWRDGCFALGIVGTVKGHVVRRFGGVMGSWPVSAVHAAASEEDGFPLTTGGNDRRKTSGNDSLITPDIEKTLRMH